MAVGVSVTTAIRGGVANPLRQPSSTYFLAGLTERGDTVNPIELRSLAEVESYTGARVTYGSVWDDLRTFFAEGGARAYFARVVGASATKGNLTLNDRAGSPLPTVRIDAKDVGAWSSGVSVAVANGDVTNTVTITITYSGTGGPLTEVFPNLATPAAIVTALANSAYVRAVDLGSATAAPNNRPAVLAATALSAGSDDRASVVAATYLSALDRFTREMGTGAVAIPGQASANVGAGLIAHAKANRRLALISAASGVSLATAIGEAQALKTTDGSEFAGLFYPFVQVSDDAGGLRTISPEGFVAGVRSRAQQSAGAWRAPAGEIGKARTVLGLATELTASEGNTADDGEVCAIRTVGGSIRLYGWRSLSTDEINWKHLHYRDVVNDVVARCEEALEPYVFRTIDSSGHLQSEMANTLLGVVQPIAAAGGLYALYDSDGNEVDPGYVIDTSDAINTEESKAQGIINAAVSVRVAPISSLIQVIITKAALTAQL